MLFLGSILKLITTEKNCNDKLANLLHQITGGPDVVFDYKTMYENTLKIALNSTCMKDLNKNVIPYVYLALFLHSCGSGVGLKLFRRVFLFDVVLPLKRNETFVSL